MKQQDGKAGNLSSLDLVEGENNYDQFFEFWLPGKISHLKERQCNVLVKNTFKQPQQYYFESNMNYL